jgi:TolB protein
MFTIARGLRTIVLCCIIAIISVSAGAQEETPGISTARLRIGLVAGDSYIPRLRDFTHQPAFPPGEIPGAVRIPWSRIVFESYRDSNFEIYSANDDGSALRRLTNQSAEDVLPSSNHGGTLIAFASKRSGNYEIYTILPDGSGLMRLTNNSTDDVGPSWSPSGNKIAFQSYRDGHAEIYLMNKDGSNQTRLTYDASGYNGQPAWSPDGTKIAFTSNRGGTWRIWLMNADGSGQGPISTEYYSESPKWSPSGAMIAYDADQDGDYWQELWLMNADGSNRRQIADPATTQIDYYAQSWSPDEKYVAFSRINWIYQNSQWRWTSAEALAWDGQGVISLFTGTKEWNLHWGSLDAGVPTSTINLLPPNSPAGFQLDWSGSDSGGSELMSFDVQVKDGSSGTWSDWQMSTTSTQGFYVGTGGHSYLFRIRARDRAYNLEPWPVDYDTSTTVESMPPQTSVQPLPVYASGEIQVSWGGFDPGGSGIQTYDIQTKDSPNGVWTDWKVGTYNSSASFSGAAGHTYFFRSRGKDYAGNLENWSAGPGDASVTIYTMAVSGVITDNRGSPVKEVQSEVSPPAVAAPLSAMDGKYGVYFASNSGTQYQITWKKNGYGNLPSTSFVDWNGDIHKDVVLPPSDDVIVNGGFEDLSYRAPGDLESWIPAGWAGGGLYEPLALTNRRATGIGSAGIGPLGERVSITGGYSTYPLHGLDDSGNLSVIWKEYNQIYYVRRNSVGNWSAPINLGATLSEYPSEHFLAVDPAGIVHAAWIQGGSPGCILTYYRRGLDGVWTAPVNISRLGNFADQSFLLLDKAGVLHAVWREYIQSSQISSILYSQLPPGGVWTEPYILAQSGDFLEKPHLAFQSGGAVHIIWSNGTQQNLIYYYVRRNTDGSWTTPEAIVNTPANLFGGHIEVDSTGGVHVAWVNDFINVYYRYRSPSGVWSDPAIISAGLSPGSTRPDMIIDSSDQLHIVWAIQAQIYYANKPQGGIWSVPKLLSAGTLYPVYPLLALDDTDGVGVIWDHSGQIAFIYRSTTGAWSQVQILSGEINNYPETTWGNRGGGRLVFGDNGEMHGVWQELFSNSNYEIVYGHFKNYSGNSFLSQKVTLDNALLNPTLSFSYLLDGVGAASNTGLYVDIQTPVERTTIFTATQPTTDWANEWLDLSEWSGQEITLTLGIHQEVGTPAIHTTLDDISLGSAYPDLWVSIDGNRSGLPGKVVNTILTAGNSGGVPAPSTILTATLPVGLSYAGANPPPTTIDGQILVWNLGSLPPQSSPIRISLYLAIDGAAVLNTSYLQSVSGGTASTEIDHTNNQAEITLWIGNINYFPLILKYP